MKNYGAMINNYETGYQWTVTTETLDELWSKIEGGYYKMPRGCSLRIFEKTAGDGMREIRRYSLDMAIEIRKARVA